MLTIRTSAIELSMQDDGTGVTVTDLVRRQSWGLDEATRLAGRNLPAGDLSPLAASAVGKPDNQVFALQPGTARRESDTTIVSEHPGPAGNVRLRWVLEKDRLRIIAEPLDDDRAADTLALPGTFRPADGETFVSAIPNGQGLLHTGKGEPFTKFMIDQGHTPGMTMAMFGQLASRGGLLSICQTDADGFCLWEKADAGQGHDGQVRLMWIARASFGKLAYPRETVIYLTPPDLTGLCKTFRRHEIAAGRFRTWDEKLASRPALAKLFGATIVFIGYVHDETLDYADSLRRLKAMGIDKAFVYPALMASTMDESVMGFRWVDIRKHIGLMDELGYAAGSFIYITDGPREGASDADFLLDASGQPQLAWQMKDSKWYVYSSAKRMEWARRMLDREHAGFSGMHYDVLCSTALREDYNPAHREDRRADLAHRKAMLDLAGSHNLIVSSEAFWGRMTPHYDLGSCKYAHVLGGEEYCVVPMTMLVYHDSAYHTWWEVDNYNNFEHRSQMGRGQTRKPRWGGGESRLMSAIDALGGLPPDIFPFGRQYNFVPHSHPQLYTYRFTLDDPLVRQAIEYAKPVAALNARVGKLELISHKLHRPDGAIQETAFADGTRVIANFANVPLEAEGLGLLPAESWRAV